MTKTDSILFMILGFVLILASIADIILQTMQSPFLTILLGLTGLVTFWLPMMMIGMDE